MSNESHRMKSLHDNHRAARFRLAGQPVLLVLLIGILFLVLGLVRGEAYQVWLRAVQICLGCIGIG